MSDPYKRHRRLGCWRIAVSRLRDPGQDAYLLAIQASAIVMDARYDIMADTMEFYGRSAFFEIVPEGNETPRYEPTFGDGGTTLQWRPVGARKEG